MVWIGGGAALEESGIKKRGLRAEGSECGVGDTLQTPCARSRIPAEGWIHPRSGSSSSSPSVAEAFWKVYSVQAPGCQRVRSFWKEFYFFRKYFWKYLHVKITCLNSLTKQALSHMQNF